MELSFIITLVSHNDFKQAQLFIRSKSAQDALCNLLSSALKLSQGLPNRDM